MTEKERELALYCLKASSNYHSEVCEECINYPNCDHTIQDDVTETIIKALEQELCEDAISRQDVRHILNHEVKMPIKVWKKLFKLVDDLPSVNPQPKTGYCKDCKYFEYDSVAKVDGIPLIVAHEICSKWGDGCKTKEDGYCFLFEPQESEE